MGKIPESTPLKISDFVLRFRESSKKFVVEILTQNFAFNLSGALFFIGLGSSLKWWYKDQLLIALLKQNLPALSEPQQKISWETGEYLIGEQTRQFLKKKRNTIFNNSILSAHSLASSMHQDQSIFCNGSKNKKIESSSFASPLVKKGDMKEIDASKMLRKRPTMLMYNQQDCEINAHPFNHLIERIDVYSNSVIVNFKSPWQKHAYHRFVGIFPELVRAGTLGLVKSSLHNVINSDQTKTFPFQKYTFWESPKNWFKISARDLCILNGESNLNPRIWTFFGKKIVPTLKLPLNAHGVDFVDEMHNINYVNVKQKRIGSTLSTFINKVNNKGISLLALLTSAANNFADSTILNTSLAELSALIISKESCSVSEVNTLLIIDNVDQKKVMKNLTIIEKLSYPLELTTTMDGWQPSIEALVLSSYLDEIPYKLGSTLSSLLCKKENQSILTVVEPSSLLIDKKTKKYPILSFKSASTLKKVGSNNKETHSPFTEGDKVIPEFLIFFSDDQITNSAGESRYTSCFVESGGLVLATQSRLSNYLLWGSNSMAMISARESSRPISNDPNVAVTSSPAVNFAVHALSPPVKGEEDKKKLGMAMADPVGVQQIKKSNKEKVNVVERLNKTKQRKSHGIPLAPTGSRGSANVNKNETLLKKWQLVEIKQLLKNELQILVNSLPLIFVDPSSTLESNHETAFFTKSYNQYSTKENQALTIPDNISATSWKDNLCNLDTTNQESPFFSSPSFAEGDVKEVQKNFSPNFVTLETRPEEAKFYTANKKELPFSADDSFYRIEDSLYRRLREPLTSTGSKGKANVNGINKEVDLESKIQSKQITNTKQKISPVSPFEKNEQLNLTEKSNLKNVISKNVDVGLKDYNETSSNKSLAPFSSRDQENFVDSFPLLDSLNITFNNLSPLKNPPILLPMHQDASFWMWNKQKTKKVNSQLISPSEIRNDDVGSYTIFRFDPKTLMWQVLSYDQNVKGLKKPIDHINKIILKQKKTTIQKIDHINLVDNEINLTNKKIKLMSGYVYPDTQSNYLKSNFYRWIQLQSFGILRDEKPFHGFLSHRLRRTKVMQTNAPSKKHKIEQSWFPLFHVVKHGSPKVMSKVFHFVKHSPGFFKNTNQVDKLDKKRNFKKRNQNGDSYGKKSLKDSISIQLLPDGNLIPRKKTNSPKSQFLFLKFPLKKSDNNPLKSSILKKELFDSHCKASLEIKPNFHDWLLYPKLFRGINRFMDKACLFGLEIPISPTTIPFYALDLQNNHQGQSTYTRFYNQMNGVDYQETRKFPASFMTNNVGNHWLLVQPEVVQAAAFPLLQKKINTIHRLRRTTNTTFDCTDWNGNFSKSSFDDLYFVFHSPFTSPSFTEGDDTLLRNVKNRGDKVISVKEKKSNIRNNASDVNEINHEMQRSKERDQNALFNQKPQLREPLRGKDAIGDGENSPTFPFLVDKTLTPSTICTTFGCNDWKEKNASTSWCKDVHNVFINTVDDQNQGKNILKETDQWKFDHHLALFPGFTKPNQFLSSITQIAQGNDISENDFSLFSDMSALGLETQAVPRKHNVSADQLVSDSLQSNVKKPIKANNQQNKNNNFIIDCSPRKTAYRGVVAQRNKFTKDFQSYTSPLFAEGDVNQKIKLRSILGTALFGPETPLTDRQSHFFGQRRLSTVDVNDFQRDYLRQLGKETLAQSNPKGKPEDSISVERVKILSFSKAINSFFLKKRKYTYLLDEKDQWHLLFQEQLRTALEDIRRYPPLTPEEAKDHKPGRIKVSAPLMMARFPKRRHSHKVLAHFRENGTKRGSPWLSMLTKSPITSPSFDTLDSPVSPFTSPSFIEDDKNQGDKVMRLCNVKEYDDTLRSNVKNDHYMEKSKISLPVLQPVQLLGLKSNILKGKVFDNKSIEFLLPEIVSHYPIFTETYNSQYSSVPWFHKSSLPFFNNLQWFTQEPLNANSWSVVSQWSFLVALLFWIEQTFLRDVFPALFALEQLLLGVSGIKSADRTHVIRVSQGDTPKFKDIAGVDGLLGELAELVLFLRGHKERLWNKKNSYGVLLTGPPGTGKTFLVRALANEAKVPVLILSAGTLAANKTNNSKPSWSIRHAFRRAKQLAPCILFIDEIDALGRSRGKIVTDINEIVADTNLNQNQKIFSAIPLSSSKFIGIENGSNTSNSAIDQEQPLSSQESLWMHQIEGTKASKELIKGYAIDRINGGSEYSEIDRYSLCEDETGKISNTVHFGETSVSDKTLSTPKESVKRQFGPLTQLLVSMDGVSNLSGVLIMGATNRPESLDPALTRPGRFERIIRVEKPAEQKRIEILQLYSRNLGVQQQIPWSYLANRTVGLTAADLAVAMNYSSLKAILQKSTHTTETIEYGLDSIARFFNRSSIKNKTSKDTSFPYSFDVQSFANCKKRRLTKSLEIQNVYKNPLFVDVIGSIWCKNNSLTCDIQRNQIKNPPDFSLEPLAVQADNESPWDTLQSNVKNKVEDQKQGLSTTFHMNQKEIAENIDEVNNQTPLKNYSEFGFLKNKVFTVVENRVSFTSPSFTEGDQNSGDKEHMFLPMTSSPPFAEGDVKGERVMNKMNPLVSFDDSESNMRSNASDVNRVNNEMQRLKEGDQVQNPKYQPPTTKPIVLDQLNRSKTGLMELERTQGNKKRQGIDKLNLIELSIFTSSKPLKDLWTKSIEKPEFNRLNAQWIFKQPESVYSMMDFKKSLQRLAQIAYYQAGKIVVQTLLPLHPPVALITLDLSGITTATSADTYVPIDDHLSVQWCSFLESRLIGLYGGKASSLLLNGQHLAKSFASPSFPSPSDTLRSNVKNKGDVKEGDQVKLWSDVLVQRKKSNIFQSNIGTKEIQIATRLAAAMVNKWAFFSSQSLQSANQFTNKVSDDVLSDNLYHWQSQCKKVINFLLGGTFAKKVSFITSFTSPLFVEGDMNEGDAKEGDPVLTSLTKHGDQRNGVFTDNFDNASPSSIKPKKFVSTDSEELYHSSLQNSNAFTSPSANQGDEKALRSLKSYFYFFKQKNSRKKQSSQFFITSSPPFTSPSFDTLDRPGSPKVMRLYNVKEGDVKGKRFTSPFVKLTRESKNVFNEKLASSNLRVSVEDVARQRKNVARTHAFQLINPLQFSIAQRERFYPGWFRLYLPDIEATEFIKNLANYYFSLGLQTLIRPSLNEFTALFLESYDIQSTLSTTFLPLIDLCENFMECGHTGNFLRPLEFSLSSHRLEKTLENKIDSHALYKTMFCGVFNNLLEPVQSGGLKSEILKEKVELVVDTAFTSPSFDTLDRPGSPKVMRLCNVKEGDANRGDPTTSWNFRQLEKQKIPGTNHQTNKSFHSISSDQVISNMVYPSGIPVTPMQNFFFSYGGNNLSIGVGLLRSAAKRRIQLYVKNQGLPKRISKTVSYPNVSTALWGFSKPWNINRLINIGFRQEAVQSNTVNSANEINSTTCLSKKDVLFYRITKKMDKWRLKSKILKEKFWISSNGFPYFMINSENLSSKAVTKIGQKPISKKANENPNQCDLMNSNSVNQLDVSLLFSVEKQIFSVDYNDVSIVEKELIYHSLVNNCFSKAFLLIDENRQLTDYFADYLVRFQILRQHQILYLFSTVLFSYKKQT